MSEPGVEAVLVTLAGAVQPDAAGGVGNPLARHIVTLDLNAPALRERLAHFFARYDYDSLRLGWTARSRDSVWGYEQDKKSQLWRGYIAGGELRADALLAELGRAA